MPAVATLTPDDGAQPATLTLVQAAQMLGVSVATVRRRVKQGSLTARKVDGPNGPEYRVTLGQGYPAPYPVQQRRCAPYQRTPCAAPG
jgi:excisionase family DNA binding protein